MELQLFEMLATGSDAAVMALLFLVYKQSQTVTALKERIIKLETELEAYLKAKD